MSSTLQVVFALAAVLLLGFALWKAFTAYDSSQEEDTLSSNEAWDLIANALELFSNTSRCIIYVLCITIEKKHLDRNNSAWPDKSRALYSCTQGSNRIDI